MYNNKISVQYLARNKKLKRLNLAYQEFLKSEYWLRVKRYLKQFSEFNSCKVCSKTNDINLHHTSYVGILNPNLKRHKKYIVSLCNDCHHKVHILTQKYNLGLRQGIRWLIKYNDTSEKGIRFRYWLKSLDNKKEDSY